jgi:hypothetical protein
MLSLRMTCLVLCAAVVVWSYSTPPRTLYSRNGKQREWLKVIVYRGSLSFNRTVIQPNLTPEEVEIVESTNDFQGVMLAPQGDTSFLGFDWYEGPVIWIGQNHLKTFALTTNRLVFGPRGYPRVERIAQAPGLVSKLPV